MNKPKTAVMISIVLGKTASIIGYTAGVIALLIIILGATDMDSEDAVNAMIFCSIVLVFCIFLIFKGVQIKKQINRFKKYIALISTERMTPIESLAVGVSEPVDFVRNDLQKMIDKKFFASAYIDVETDELVIEGCDDTDFGQESRARQDTRLGIKMESDAEQKCKPVNCEYIEYEVTEKDLIGAFENDLKKPVLQRYCLYYFVFQLIIVIFGGVAFLLYFADAPAPLILLSVFAIPVAGVLLVIWFSRRRRAARIFKGRLRRGEIELQYFGLHRFELKEDGIEQRYGTICVRRQYAGIQKTVEYPGGIMVYSSQLDRDIIPSSAFGDAQQRGTFLNHLQARIAQAKNVGISEKSMEEHKQDTNYVLEYTWDEPSFITAMAKANRLLFKTRLAWTTGPIIMTLIGLFFCFAGTVSLIGAITEMSEFYRQGMALMPGGLCCGVGIGLLSPLFVAFTPLGKKLYRQQIDNGVVSRDYFSPQSICFKEDRITELRRLNCYDVMYDKIYCVKQDADGMYLLLKGKRGFVIPNSAFPTDDRKREIADYIEKKAKEMVS